MKKIILSLAAGFAACSAFSQAPNYAPVPLPGLPPSILTAVQTNFAFASAPTIFVGNQRYVTLEFNSILSANGSNVVIVLAPSVSGIYYETNAATGQSPGGNRLITITYTNDMTLRSFQTNIDCAGYGYLKLLSIYNKEGTGSATWTNLGVYYSVKQSAP